MSKMIAFCGSPESGKTTASLKTAQELYYSKKGSVIFLSTDMRVPSLAYLFPRQKDSELFSLGKALDKTDIYKEDVIKQLVTVKSMQNFGYLGYKAGENKFSYPQLTEDKIIALFCVLKGIADYVVVDCANDADDLISKMALNEADSVIQMITPDLKCIAYYSSQAEMFDTAATHSIKVLNVRESDLYLPIEEVKSHFKNVQFILPYSRPLKQQVVTGTLSERVDDKKYREQVLAIAKEVA